MTTNKQTFSIYLLGIPLMLFIAYIYSVIKNISKSLYVIFDYPIFYGLLTTVFLVLVLLFTNKFVKQVYKQEKISHTYLFIFIITSIAFIYDGVPKILHLINKKNITIDAKVIDVKEYKVRSGSYSSTRGVYYYNGYIIETSFLKLNKKEIFNFNYKLYPLLKKDTNIQIQGTTSDYLFKVNHITIQDN
jgi:hypothetical protein